MRRTLEKLAKNRESKEKDFAARFEEIKQKCNKLQDSFDSPQIKNLITSLEGIQEKTDRSDDTQKHFNQQIVFILKELQKNIAHNNSLTNEIFSSIQNLSQNQTELVDAKDKEYDALSSNHVGMIFKSMEWRVSKLAAEAEDANILMKKFFLLREKLHELLTLLEQGEKPEPSLVREILQPMEDWRYAGFENRYRGSEEDIKQQQSIYLDYYQPGKKVLDMGCGRGEFIESLQEKGIEAKGIDLNEQMIDICLDKGLNCQKADIQETLEQYENNSLGGIFSSQVIEHLSPAYLRRVIELAYQKLEPSGSIVLETVNPLSVFALVQIYFLDLSHQQPIHPETLRFLLENVGFINIEIKYSGHLDRERLRELPASHEIACILNENFDKLNELIYAPPNYAAIGYKK